MINYINIITYIIYLALSIYITVWVGNKIFQYGEIFLLEIFKTNTSIVKPINKILLTGYYLINIGYVILLLMYSRPLSGLSEIFELLSEKLGIVILTLGIIHVFNLMLFIIIYTRNKVNN